MKERVVLTNARVFDSVRGVVSESATIVIADGKFEAIVRSGELPSGQRIDVANRIVLPGLIDVMFMSTPYITMCGSYRCSRLR